MARVCPRCGYHNPFFAKYCKLCYTPLKEGLPPKKWDFYKLISKNKRDSILLLVVLFALLIGMGWLMGEMYGNTAFWMSMGVGISLLSGFSSYYGGKAIVLASTHAKKIEKEDYPELYNVVEEMSIASGLPMPEVYVVDDPAPNAFATGRDPHHAAVAVTTGLLKMLNREELQGVIAHEMGHIYNFDIRFSTMIAVIVGSIILLAEFMMYMARLFAIFGDDSDRRRRGGSSSGAGAIVLVIALVVYIFVPLFSRILQMAVSRRRELLADAMAVRFTRNPNGLASALEKIAFWEGKPKYASKSAQHLYIVNPFQKVSLKSSGLFSTHPPIESRIAILRSMTVS